ncbi:hypothetical protein MN608_00556 [Microdochium nivale]|nr:hypothetical protein MN608_00556 [Microdochium nivale]
MWRTDRVGLSLLARLVCPRGGLLTRICLYTSGRSLKAPAAAGDAGPRLCRGIKETPTACLCVSIRHSPADNAPPKAILALGKIRDVHVDSRSAARRLQNPSLQHWGFV